LFLKGSSGILFNFVSQIYFQSDEYDAFFLSKGKLSTMKRGQDDISQAKRETDCGLSFEKFTDVEEGDVVQCYTITVTKQSIDWNWGF